MVTYAHVQDMASRFVRTPDCPDCGARAVRDCDVRTVQVPVLQDDGTTIIQDQSRKVEIDISEHFADCPALREPDWVRALRMNARRQEMIDGLAS